MLDRFLKGTQSHDNDVLTAITVSTIDDSRCFENSDMPIKKALNVVIRMEPTQYALLKFFIFLFL